MAELVEILFPGDRFKEFEAATLRGVDRWMHRAGTPFDEKWEHPAGVVLQRERFPVENAAVGAFSGTGVRAIDFNFFGFQALRECLDVAGMLRPADNHRFVEGTEIALVVGGGLLRVGCDDFEIAICAEREQRVARASAGMDSTERGTNAGALFDKLDAGVEVGATDQNVIEQFGNG